MSRVLRCSGYDLVKTDVVRAQGCTLYDAQGRRTLDLEAGVWCAALGHNHPRVNGVIRAQLDRVAHLACIYSAEVVEQAAQTVRGTLPPPGGITGECADCNSPWRICNKTVIIRREFSNDRYSSVTTVVIVGEELGR